MYTSVLNMFVKSAHVVVSITLHVLINFFSYNVMIYFLLLYFQIEKCIVKLYESSGAQIC